jgi:hypothetical protein
MPKRQRIKKSAEVAATATAEPTVHELTNITVQEVSLVDRPANERTFLLRKKAEEAAKDDAEKTAKTAADALAVETTIETVEAEGIDLVAAAKAAEELKAKDAADLAKKQVDEAAATTAAADLVSAAKADITVTTADGSAVTVSVPEVTEPVVVPAAPAELIDKVKAATLAGIDAIAARLVKFRSDVNTSPVSPWSTAGTSDVLWSHIYYLKGMLEALYDIGGPSWEIESAGDAVDKSVKKGHKAITTARVAKLGAIHTALTYCMKDYAGVMKELTQEQDDAAALDLDPLTAGTELTGKAAPVVVATPIAPVTKADPIVEELKKSVEALTNTVAKQSAEMAKARNSVAQSNSLPPEEIPATDVPSRDIFVWPSDLAPPINIKKRRF